VAEEQGTLGVVGEFGHIRQDQGRADGEDATGGVDADAAESDAEFGGGARVLDAVSLVEALGEEFGRVTECPFECLSERCRRGDGLLVVALVEGQADGRTLAGRVAPTLGHGSPPSWTGSQGESWPFLLFRILAFRSLNLTMCDSLLTAFH